MLLKKLFVKSKLSLLGSSSFGFAQNTMHEFQNTVLNSKWYCLRQLPQKKHFEKYFCVLEIFDYNFFIWTW